MARRTTRKSSTPEDLPAVEDPEMELEEEQVVIDRKAFIERVVERSGERRSNVKGASEATLAVLAEALASGESLALGPMGKFQVVRRVERSNGQTLTVKVKLRNPKVDPEAQEPEE